MWSVSATKDKYFFVGSFLEDLDTISLIDVYEGLIHDAIQYKELHPYLYYQTHIP